MKIVTLSNAQTANLGFTHRFELTYADLTTAATTQTTTLMAYTAGKGITGAASKIVTLFSGGSATDLTIKVGWDGATTDDDDGAISATSVHTSGSYVKYQDGNGAAFATLRTGYFPQDAGNYTILFTATGANVSTLTAGEVHIYLRITDLATG